MGGCRHRGVIWKTSVAMAPRCPRFRRSISMIRFANVAKRAGSRGVAPDDSARRVTKEWQAMASGEARLASSIAAALTGGFGLHSVVDDVIRPIFQEAIVVSETAHHAILRAFGRAAPDREGRVGLVSTRIGS